MKKATQRQHGTTPKIRSIEMPPVLDAEGFYLRADGGVTCGRHASIDERFKGVDENGQPLMALGADEFEALEVRRVEIHCETCVGRRLSHQRWQGRQLYAARAAGKGLQ